MTSPYPEIDKREKSERPTAAELRAEVDALCARIGAAEVALSTAEAQAVDTIDYEAHWRDLLGQYTAVYRRIAAMKDGGA